MSSKRPIGIVEPITFLIKVILSKNFGGRENINKTLSESLLLSESFWKQIKKSRIKVFKKEFKDEWENDFYLGDLQDAELGDFCFRSVLSDIDSHRDSRVEEDIKTPLNKFVREILDKFKLPANFYVWVFYIVDTGKEPKFVPIYDTDAINRAEYYLEENSGLTSKEKNNMISFFKREIYHKDKKLFIMIKNLIKSIPVNKFRNKKVVDEVNDYIKKKKGYLVSFDSEKGEIKSRKTSSIIATELMDSRGIDLPFEEEKKLSIRLASKMRKRKSRYIK